MKPLRWSTNADDHRYMRERQAQNVAQADGNAAEEWMQGLLATTRRHWTRQAIWGHRIFDFWSAELGAAVEVDGWSHDPDYDAYRDEYNFRRSGIVVLRVRNFDRRAAVVALSRIARLPPLPARRKLLAETIGVPAALVAMPAVPRLLPAWLRRLDDFPLSATVRPARPPKPPPGPKRRDQLPTFPRRSVSR